MTRYEAISSLGKWIIRKVTYEGADVTEEYFTGYDFMGTDNWTDSAFHNCINEYDSKEEAEWIIQDLKAAEDPESEEPNETLSFDVKMTKSQVKLINDLAKRNWEKAQGRLDGVNMILGTNYRWLNKRVVFLAEAHGQIGWHDAYAWAK